MRKMLAYIGTNLFDEILSGECFGSGGLYVFPKVIDFAVQPVSTSIKISCWVEIRRYLCMGSRRRSLGKEVLAHGSIGSGIISWAGGGAKQVKT